MKDEDKKRIVDVLGDEAAAFDSNQLGAATAEFLEEATKLNHELSTANAGLTTQVTSLSAEKTTLEAQVTELSANKPADTVELSAATKVIHTENVGHKIDHIAGKNGWSAATTEKWKKALAADGTVNLSASAGGDVSQTINLSVLFDLASELPVQGIVPGEKTDVLNLSRVASDDGRPAPSTDNPLLAVAKSVASKA